MVAQVLVLFNDGEFGIWDVEHNARIATSNYFTKSRDLRAIDVDWLSDAQPILATTDGCIRVVDKQLSGGCNSPIHFTSLAYPLHSPLLLPPTQSLFLKAMLLHPELQSRDSSDLTGLVDQYTMAALRKTTLLAERALTVAQYFGHASDIRFWLLAISAFRRGSSQSNQEDLVASAGLSSTLSDGSDGFRVESELTQSSSSSSSNLSSTAAPTVPASFDLLADSVQVKSMYHNRAALHEQKKSGNYQLTQKIIDFNLTLGEKDKAIDLLLETPSENPQFYADALKACVVAASVSPTTFQNTVKLVATNLISNDAIEEGVQLLCLIGKSLDACNVLQTYDRWSEAALLAKLTLGPADVALVFRRWANFLISSNQLIEAVEVELTLGDWDAVLYLLHRAGLPDLAALFARAAGEFGVLSPDLMDRKAPSQQEISMKQLLESIYADYGFYLSRIGYKRAARHYWENFSGEAGLQFLQSNQ